MHFLLRPKELDRGFAGERSDGIQALKQLEWALTEFETPEPVAIDLSNITSISRDFVDAFFLPLCLDPPSGPYGPHPIVVVRASADVACVIDNMLSEHLCAIPIQRSR